MQTKYNRICTGTVVIQPQRNIRQRSAPLLYTDTCSWSQPDKSTAWFITSHLIRHDTSFKWTLSFVPANPFLIYGRPDSSNLIFSLSHIDKLKIREVQLNSLSSERPSLLLETHFQHWWPSTTELQELSLIHIVTCLQNSKSRNKLIRDGSLEGPVSREEDECQLDLDN